jgi:hypothetical protein
VTRGRIQHRKEDGRKVGEGERKNPFKKARITLWTEKKTSLILSNFTGLLGTKKEIFYFAALPNRLFQSS